MLEEKQQVLKIIRLEGRGGRCDRRHDDQLISL